VDPRVPERVCSFCLRCCTASPSSLRQSLPLEGPADSVSTSRHSTSRAFALLRWVAGPIVACQRLYAGHSSELHCCIDSSAGLVHNGGASALSCKVDIQIHHPVPLSAGVDLFCMLSADSTVFWQPNTTIESMVRRRCQVFVRGEQALFLCQYDFDP